MAVLIKCLNCGRNFIHHTSQDKLVRTYPVQIACLAIFLHNLSPCPFWSTSWSGALHLTFQTFLHPINVFFLQHMPVPSQPVLLWYQYYIIYS